MNALHPGEGYIYSLSDPDTGEVFYVGETVKGIHSRLFHHLSKALDPTWKWYNNSLPTRLREILARGLPNVSLLETISSTGNAELDKTKRLDAEKCWISKLRSEGRQLLNADRSDVMRRVHANRTPEQRREISRKGAGKRRKK